MNPIILLQRGVYDFLIYGNAAALMFNKLFCTS
jgi:hypothetical protein